jgi:hypothetical protein
VVAQRGALREPGRPARVLDVDRVVEAELGRARRERAGIDCVRTGDERVPVRRTEVHDLFEVSERRRDLVDHRAVVARLELGRSEERPTP